MMDKSIRRLRALAAVASNPRVARDIAGALSRGALGDARRMARTVAAPHPGAKLLSRKYRWLWMINPKVASRSIMAALRGADPDAERAGERSVSELYALDPEARKYYSFAFVRHPFARALFLYFDMHVSPEVYTEEQRLHRGKGIRYLFGSFYGLAETGSFEDYCECLNTPYGSDAVADRHFLSQHRQICLADGRLPDFVGRIENIDEDWKRLAARLGLPATALPLMNTMAGWETTPDALKAARSAAMEAHVTERSKTLLRTRYAEDFRLFGYSPD